MRWCNVTEFQGLAKQSRVISSCNIRRTIHFSDGVWLGRIWDPDPDPLQRPKWETSHFLPRSKAFPQQFRIIRWEQQVTSSLCQGLHILSSVFLPKLNFTEMLKLNLKILKLNSKPQKLSNNVNFTPFSKYSSWNLVNIAS